MEKRIEYIDLAKGICILLVIAHHVYGSFSDTEIGKMILCFRMPLYYFLSGMFFNKYTGLPDFIVKKINKLLIPFAFFVSMTIFLYCFFWIIDKHYYAIGQIPHDFYKSLKQDYIYLNVPLWFLISLFETSIIFYLIITIESKVKGNISKLVVLAVSSFATGIIGFELGTHHLNLPLWIDTSMTAVPFYFMGYFIKKNTTFIIPNKYDKYSFFLLTFLVLIVYAEANHIEMIANKYDGTFFSFYLSGISGTLFVLQLSKLVKKVPVISYLGRYSVIVLGTHYVLIDILDRYSFFISESWLSISVKFLFVSIISIPIAMVLLKYFPKFVCQEELIKIDFKKNKTPL